MNTGTVLSTVGYIPVQESPLAPWPGYLFLGTILTPDIDRFRREVSLIWVQGTKLIRVPGPVRE